MDHPLRAPLEIEFDYTRSLGPVLSQFMTGLRDRRILGTRGADGRVHAPPFEYDPVSAEPPVELTEIGSEGTVVSWSWMPEPLEGQPLGGPFAWALIRLDGADTVMLHAVDAGSAAVMRTGLRVRARWAASRVGSIRDIACFEPCDAPVAVAQQSDATGGVPVEMTVTPVRLHYEHTASPGESAYLRGLADRRLLGQRCGVCGQVYVPPRGTCPADGVPTREEVELPETGTVTTFCVVNMAYPGQRVTPPYVAAAVLLDGADIAFQHLILGCEPSAVHLGMRVRAVWRPRAEWGTS
ncbi:MAG TPA: OB-fold domain-containing protein, partial [Streptosporangiaceae bacterium]|nr:OB-fold domain-containing protein [Streptosporangiaceae bacterium]